MPGMPFPVQALALILMGLGSGIFWSPVVSASLETVSVS